MLHGPPRLAPFPPSTAAIACVPRCPLRTCPRRCGTGRDSHATPATAPQESSSRVDQRAVWRERSVQETCVARYTSLLKERRMMLAKANKTTAWSCVSVCLCCAWFNSSCSVRGRGELTVQPPLECLKNHVTNTCTALKTVCVSTRVNTASCRGRGCHVHSKSSTLTCVFSGGGPCDTGRCSRGGPCCGGVYGACAPTPDVTDAGGGAAGASGGCPTEQQDWDIHANELTQEAGTCKSWPGGFVWRWSATRNDERRRVNAPLLWYADGMCLRHIPTKRNQQGRDTTQRTSCARSESEWVHAWCSPQPYQAGCTD